MTAQIVERRSPQDQLGRPLRDLRISVIDRCNFRCPYCMPAEIFGDDYRFLKRRDWLEPGEIVRLSRLFTQLGVTKLRVTGGEPLLRRDIHQIIAGLSALDGVEDIALTTNGVRLPEFAAKLAAAGLKRITVSLDSLDPETFAVMSGGKGDVRQVLQGIEAANEAGLAPVKVNVVVKRGVNDEQVLDLLEFFRGTSVIVRFIEYMDVGSLNGWRLDDVVSSLELKQKIEARWPLTPTAQNYRGEVATRYRYSDGAGEIGFISSVSAPFCGDCHRARIAADGTFYTCLFAKQGANLREPLRAGASDAELTALLREVWSARKDRYSELRGRETIAIPKIEMYRMGG